MIKHILKVMAIILVAIAIILSSSYCFGADTISDTLPDAVDNSDSPYFPEIGNQGTLGACVYWT